MMLRPSKDSRVTHPEWKLFMHWVHSNVISGVLTAHEPTSGRTSGRMRYDASGCPIGGAVCPYIMHGEEPNGGGMARRMAGRAGGFFRFTGGRGGHAARAPHAARDRPRGPL